MPVLANMRAIGVDHALKVATDCSPTAIVGVLAPERRLHSDALQHGKCVAMARLRPEDEDLGLEQGVGLVKCAAEWSLSARCVPRGELQD
jgi:hypothetical protein